MAYKYKKKKAKRCNYGSKRALSKIKYPVVHYTGNDGDTDEGNANYFAKNNVGASAHYFIDDDSVTQSVPDNYIAWAVGSTGLLDQGSPYKSKGAKYFGKCTNTNSISFELCDTIDNNKLMVSKKTRANAVAFIAKKMVELNIPIKNLIRHFDVNGKLCPIYYVTDAKAWEDFKADIGVEMARLKKEKKKTKKKYDGTFPKLPSRCYFKSGDNGKQARYLQEFLNWYGDYDLDEDGIVGENTIAAVKKFQKAEGLVVDGKFGKNSLAKAKKVKR